MVIPMDPRDRFGSDAPIIRREVEPPSPESIRKAVDACNRERDEVRAIGLNVPRVPYPLGALPLDQETQHALLQDHERVIGAAHRWGYMRLLHWLQNAAKDEGVEL
jgi:hypothetical protein